MAENQLCRDRPREAGLTSARLWGLVSLLLGCAICGWVVLGTAGSHLLGPLALRPPARFGPSAAATCALPVATQHVQMTGAYLGLKVPRKGQAANRGPLP